eukprot:CAMPEP_0196575004 /NCGR_PEP_ID=MMETSP1081-20130531/4585_1 /TAXON_ID=36882 /ORGANISM="Pyramimonas amylifera, Strain CCMP720" /LENGTH=168 /DNA_ID=CAMNT_0041893181 /DNA_START=217 /DNA_END=723 /DNA_ORIENTATION=-
MEAVKAQWAELTGKLNNHSLGRYPAGTSLIHINEGSAPGRLERQWECSPNGTFGSASKYCKPLMRRKDLDPDLVRAICRIYAVDYAVFQYPLPPECRERTDPEMQNVKWYGENDVQCGKNRNIALRPIEVEIRTSDEIFDPDEFNKVQAMQDRFYSFQNQLQDESVTL